MFVEIYGVNMKVGGLIEVKCCGSLALEVKELYEEF